MDHIELQTLREEMRHDSQVVVAALQLARSRFERQDQLGYEGCAHHLARMYNAVEQMGLRVAKAFENSIDDEKGWHSGLLNRLSLEITGVRPALIPLDLKLALQELKAFRHVFVDAYELELDPEKLALLLKYAGQVAARLPTLVEDFVRKVANEQEIDLGPGNHAKGVSDEF